MKKLIFALMLTATVAFSVFADEGFAYGFWFESPKDVKTKSVDGIALGIPVISFRNLSGASLAICGNDTKKTSGFEFAFLGFNRAESLEGVQLAFVNLQDGQHGDFSFQMGAYNQAGKNGIQLGFINNGKDNATFQFGLININKNGLLPVMIFVNFGKDLFK